MTGGGQNIGHIYHTYSIEGLDAWEKRLAALEARARRLMGGATGRGGAGGGRSVSLPVIGQGGGGSSPLMGGAAPRAVASGPAAYVTPRSRAAEMPETRASAGGNLSGAGPLLGGASATAAAAGSRGIPRYDPAASARRNARFANYQPNPSPEAMAAQWVANNPAEAARLRGLEASRGMAPALGGNIGPGLGAAAGAAAGGRGLTRGGSGMRFIARARKDMRNIMASQMGIPIREFFGPKSNAKALSGFGMFMNAMFGGWELGQAIAGRQQMDLDVMMAQTPSERLKAYSTGLDAQMGGIFGMGVRGLDALAGNRIGRTQALLQTEAARSERLGTIDERLAALRLDKNVEAGRARGGEYGALLAKTKGDFDAQIAAKEKEAADASVLARETKFIKGSPQQVVSAGTGAPGVILPATPDQVVPLHSPERIAELNQVARVATQEADILRRDRDRALDAIKGDAMRSLAGRMIVKGGSALGRLGGMVGGALDATEGFFANAALKRDKRLEREQLEREHFTFASQTTNDIQADFGARRRALQAQLNGNPVGAAMEGVVAGALGEARGFMRVGNSAAAAEALAIGRMQVAASRKDFFSNAGFQEASGLTIGFGNYGGAKELLAQQGAFDAAGNRLGINPRDLTDIKQLTDQILNAIKQLTN